jgi:hypothetical protein
MISKSCGEQATVTYLNIYSALRLTREKPLQSSASEVSVLEQIKGLSKCER